MIIKLNKKGFLSLLFFGSLFIYLLFLFQKISWFGDEGMVLSSALRVTSGEVMYKDFFEFWTPGTVYFAALVLKIFGRNLFIFRLISAICLGTTIFLSYRITQKIVKNYFISLIPSFLIVSLFQVYTTGFNHHWLSLAFLTFAIWWVLGLSKFKTSFFVAGILIGISSLFIQLEGIIGLISLSFFILLTPEPLRSKVIKFLFFLGGIFTIWVIPLYFFWQNQAAMEMISAIISFPLFYYHHYNFRLPSFIWWVFSFFHLIFILVLKRKIVRTPSLLLLALMGVISNLFILISPNPNHVALGAPFTLPLMIYFYSKHFVPLFQSAQTPSQSFRALFTNTSYLRKAVLANFSFFVLLWFVLHLVSYSFPGFLFAHTKITSRVNTKAGWFYTTLFQAEKIQTILSFINKNTKKGEYLFIGPYAAQFYFFTEAQNPTRYSQLSPKYNPDWMLKEAVEDIRRKNPRFIILLPSESPLPFDEDNFLASYVQAKYEPLHKLPNNPLSHLENSPNDAIYVRKKK